MEDAYTPLYYQTIADTGIDPVVCGGPVAVGRVSASVFGPRSVGLGGGQPVQMGVAGVADAKGGVAKVPRKRAPRKSAKASINGGQGGGEGIHRA